MGLLATRVGPTSCTSRSGPRLRGARPASRILLSWTRSGLSQQVSPPLGGGSGQNTGRRPLVWFCLLPSTAPKAAAGVRRVVRDEVRAEVESGHPGLRGTPLPGRHPSSWAQTSRGSRAPGAGPIEPSPAHSSSEASPRCPFVLPGVLPAGELCQSPWLMLLNHLTSYLIVNIQLLLSWVRSRLLIPSSI